MIDNGEFIEYNIYNDNFYGTSIKELGKSTLNKQVLTT